MTAREFRALIEEKGKLEAVSIASKAPCSEEQAADGFIYNYVCRLLNVDNYGDAGIVLWGERICNPRPSAVRKVWRAIKRNSLTLLQGGSSMSKSYSGTIYFFLDWIRDPEFTNIKIISTTAGHAKANTFSTMAMLARNACIKLPGVVQNDYIGLDPKERFSGISIIAIPEGDSGSTALQGFHPIPRPKPHPVLGDVSRVRAFVDEAEGVPVGVWGGVDNMQASAHGTETIKIVAAYNPHDPSSKVAQSAAPEGGWGQFDVETGVKGKDEWISRDGWFVCRLDPAKSENVMERKLVYPGFHTYEGYSKIKEKSGGNTPEYFTFGRGAYPAESAVRVVIQSAYYNRCRGEFVFDGKTVKFAGLDVAVDGRDNAILTIGRVGTALAFQPRTGDIVRFPVARMAAQVDGQFHVKKGSVKIVGDDAIRQCKDVGVAPENFMGDSTGNGAAVISYMKAIWSEDVDGLDFSGRCTTTKILAQHDFTPEEKYDGIVTEVWFAAAAWMEFLYLAISPMVRGDQLESEALGRRYKNVGKKLVNGEQRELTRVEKKDEYILRLHHSPDFMDSLTIFLHKVRMKANIVASMTGKPPEQKKVPLQRTRVGVVDRVQWVNTSETV